MNKDFDLHLDNVISQTLLERVQSICVDAGIAIMGIYQKNTEFSVELKKDDTPLTQADMSAHKILVEGLSQLIVDTPILSEEADLPPFEERRTWPLYWLIDPLDGTKEFISRNGEFTVNVALIYQGKPVLGVVYIPASGESYVGARGLGAYKVLDGEKKTISVRKLEANQDPTIVASRRHGVEQVEKILAKLRVNFGAAKAISIGSSLKFCLIAEGKADLYPRTGPTSEWDTAAAQAVLEAAGGQVVDTEFSPLVYNQKDNILNPNFYAIGDKNYDWRAVLA
ncbi:3'(2'),5'-bisphosphate nucleotidase CysQ [Aurantivibrio infirmus]